MKELTKKSVQRSRGEKVKEEEKILESVKKLPKNERIVLEQFTHFTTALAKSPQERKMSITLAAVRGMLYGVTANKKQVQDLLDEISKQTRDRPFPDETALFTPKQVMQKIKEAERKK